MKSILSYLLTPMFLVVFISILLIFHPIQMISLAVGGYHAHKRSVEIMNILIIRSLHLLGTRISFSGFGQLKEGRPLIIVSNHQSAMDIPPIVWGFRRHHPKFISKKELGKWLPSISYNLNHGGSILIDRRDKAQSIREISKLGKVIEEKNYAAVLFPEGTRTRNGNLRKFKTGGLHTLLNNAPSALIVPFAIRGNYELTKNGFFPMGIGVKATYKVLEPLEPGDRDAEEITRIAEERIREFLAS